MFVSALVVAVVARVLPLFDASPRLQRPLSAAVRWDALHFVAIADAGYKYENQWAFLPGVPWLINLLGFQSNAYIWPVVLLVVAADAARTLYRLTRFHFPASPAVARLVVVLSLFPSSPATLYLAPYAEPFFTNLSYRGMLYAAQHDWLCATLCFVLASFFRSNGILLAGYLVWGLVVQPFLDRRQLSPLKVSYSIVLSACVAAPFIYHNYSAYRLFCNVANEPEWCHHIPPSIYSHVQAHYWNNGFLHYWTSAQIPNFIIASPPLVLLTVFSVQHVKILASKFLFNGVGDIKKEASPFAKPSITPHLIHSLVMCITLVFFSHTQIVLRLAAALPTLYWAAAWLFMSPSPWAKVWIWWSVLWGCISLGLWTAFLPPA